MAQKHRFRNNHGKGGGASATDRRPAPLPVYEPKPPVVYGKPILVLEDSLRNTFEFKSGAWVPFELSIAECRRTCQVKQLAQKINNMTRYEVCRPV